MQMFRKAAIGLVLGLALATANVALGEPKIPATPEEHFALAKEYAQKAETYRKEAADHRKMAEAYRNSPANAPMKLRGDERNPQVAKMEKHCNAIVVAADKLAVDNEKAADFHNLRGKELQGK
jgi:hypothetical protein